MSSKKTRLLKAFGAEVIVTPTAVPPDHPDNYVMKAKAIAASTPGAGLDNQFYNQVNPEAHYRTTGPEIWEQTGGRVTHFVAAPGTGGTLSGTGRYLKEHNPKVQIVAGDPEGSILAEYFRTKRVGAGRPYKVEGIGNDKVPETLHCEYIDEFHTVGDAEAFQVTRRLVREEVLFVGIWVPSILSFGSVAHRWGDSGMNDLGLFVAGVLVTIPAVAGIGVLILAAIADGRENDRIQAQRKLEDSTRK